MKAKLIFSNATIIIISVCVFLNGYVMSLGVPVYADSTTDNWHNVTTNAQLVEAFRYYCKSRDVTINGGVADAVTHFTTKTFNGICNTLGIDVTALQAQLKYQTDGNVGARFLFTSTGIDAYNRIFAQFLQDNDLEVGDENVNDVVYSGRYFKDDDGNGAFVYICTTLPSSPDFASKLSYVKEYGSKYKYDGNDLVSLYNGGSAAVFNINNSTLSYVVEKYDIRGYVSYCLRGYTSDRNKLYYSYYGSMYQLGHMAIIYVESNNSLYLGQYVYNYQYNNECLSSIRGLNDLSKAPETNITIVSTVINNNTYEGDTIINNNGTTGDDNDPDPDPDPDNPNYNPYPDGGGTVTPPGNVGGGGSDGTINFPDFNINLPEINWSLGDLSQKFPFSIPFDMIAFLTLLNGEPQAPHITGTIPLTSHYTWNLDLDFSQFDTFAGIMRGLEFVGFMFFLISATINIVRG